jgi:hypothetical protein
MATVLHSGYMLIKVNRTVYLLSILAKECTSGQEDYGCMSSFLDWIQYISFEALFIVPVCFKTTRI